MTYRRIKPLAFTVVCALTLFTGPSMFAIIWGPLGLPPLGTAREVAFFSCANGIPANTGYEDWDCLRHLHHTGSPSNYAWAYDTDCETNEESNFTYWCQSSNGTWHQMTYAEFDNCDTCPEP
jgi:hypothetical protein